MGKLEDLLAGLRGPGCSGRDCSGCEGNASAPELCGEMMCMATPHEIARLIHAGYAHLIRILPAMKVSVDVAARHIERKRVWMAQIAADENGCALHRDGTCLLSGAGLTPKMGTLHLQGDVAAVRKRYPEVIGSWEEEGNIPVIAFCLLTVLNRDDEKNKPAN